VVKEARSEELAIDKKLAAQMTCSESDNRLAKAAFFNLRRITIELTLLNGVS
jgi:hypothetical protein